MASSVLSFIQRAFNRQGLPKPSSAVGNPDRAVAQALGLLEEFLDDMVTRKTWAQVTKEAKFLSIAQEDQGSIYTLTDPGFASIKLNSMWDRTQILPIEGGETSETWQTMHAVNLRGPLPKYRLWQNRLYFFPVPAAGHQIAFEYFSSYMVLDKDNVTWKRYWTDDADTCVFDDALPTAYLRWAWKREKGLDYAEEFARYENLIATFGASHGAPKVVDLSGEIRSARPGIIVPEGSWNL